MFIGLLNKITITDFSQVTSKVPYIYSSSIEILRNLFSELPQSPEGRGEAGRREQGPSIEMRVSLSSRLRLRYKGVQMYHCLIKPSKVSWPNYMTLYQPEFQLFVVTQDQCVILPCRYSKIE